MRQTLLIAVSLLLIPTLLPMAVRADTVVSAPSTEADYLNLAQKLYDACKKTEAIDSLDHALLINPKSDRAYALRGECRVLGDPTTAAQDYKKALEINPKNVDALAGLGNIEITKGNQTQAKTYLLDAVKIEPKSAITWLRLGVFALTFETGSLRTSDALVCFGKSVEYNPQLAIGYYDLGVVHQELRDNDLAIADYTKSLELDPKNKEGFNNRGVVYKRLEKYDLSASDLIQATKLDPTYSDAFYNLAVTYKLQQDWPNALTAIANARRLSPTDDDVKTQLKAILDGANINLAEFIDKGNVFYNDKDYASAIEQYDKVLSYDPVHHNMLYNRAVAYQQWGKNKEAHDAYRDFVRFYSDNKTAYESLADLAQIAGDLTEAIDNYQKAIAMDSNYADAYRGLASAYRLQKEYEKAFVQYAKALAIDPNYAAAYNDRGLAYVQTKQWELGFIDYSHVIQLNDKTYIALAIWKRSYLYYMMGDYEKAVSEMKRAQALDAALKDFTFTPEEAAHNKKDWDARVHPAVWASVVP